MPNIFREPKALKKWAIQLANACGGQEVSTSPLLTTLNTNKIKDLLDVFVEDHNENTQAIAEEMMSKQANKEEE
jgi:hypothetical protein|tara:strand:- start:1100 stop:1321 length:222 start_codon:yes stop_codon:yes gene_type:complete